LAEELKGFRGKRRRLRNAERSSPAIGLSAEIEGAESGVFGY